jgi:hypothetical protein
MCDIIQLIAGDDNYVEFIYNDTDNNAVDLTDYSEIRMQLRQAPSADVLIEISKIEGSIVLDGINKLNCTIKVPQLACGFYEGDMRFEIYTDGPSIVKRMGRWTFEIIEDITR